MSRRFQCCPNCLLECYGYCIGRPVLLFGTVAIAVVVRVDRPDSVGGGNPGLQPGGVLDDAVDVELVHRVASGDLLLRRICLDWSARHVLPGLVFAPVLGDAGRARVVQVLWRGGAVLVAFDGASGFGRRAGLLAGLRWLYWDCLSFNGILEIPGVGAGLR